MKYFVVNKELDYKRGYLEGAEFSQGSLRLREGESQGVFISRVFDGKETDLAWHRFCLNGEGPGGGSLYFWFYCTDSLEFTDGDMAYRIPELLGTGTYPWKKRRSCSGVFSERKRYFRRISCFMSCGDGICSLWQSCSPRAERDR